jgi:hypothetical protein
MTESSGFLCLTSSSSRRSDVPTPMKPPTMTVAPLGIRATASSAGFHPVSSGRYAADRRLDVYRGE